MWEADGGGSRIPRVMWLYLGREWGPSDISVLVNGWSHFTGPHGQPPGAFTTVAVLLSLDTESPPRLGHQDREPSMAGRSFLQEGGSLAESLGEPLSLHWGEQVCAVLSNMTPIDHSACEIFAQWLPLTSFITWGEVYGLSVVSGEDAFS